MLSLRTAHLSLMVPAAFAFLAAGCDKMPQKSAEKTEAATFALGVKRAAADSLWTAMMASDDKKIENVQFFLKFAKYADLGDTNEIHHIRMANDSLKLQRYNQQNVRELVDDYDRATDHVVQSAAELYNANPGVQNVNTGQLLEEIKMADDSVLIFRAAYDRAADAYNQQLQEDEKVIKKLETKPERLPLFRLEM